jgi:exosortase
MAIALFSPSLGYMALLFGLGSLVIRITGSAVGAALGPVWWLAWLLVPPPFELDVRLIQSLQERTAGVASLLLDMLGHRHCLEGNILEFTGHQFFVEEACSGVQSLFSLLAVALLFNLWKRRSLPHGLALALAAVVWALVVNVTRVLIIGIVYALTGCDIASGVAHGLLGFTLFGLAVVLVLSTDELIGFFLGPIVVPYGMAMLNPFSRRWNRWVSNSPPGIARPTRPAAVEIATEVGDGAIACRSIERPPAWLVCAFATLGLVQLAGLAGIVARTDAPTDAREADLVAAEALPHSLDGWQRTDSKLTERGPESYEGRYSRIWTYTGSEYVALVSCDYPFAAFHELTHCYISKGWQVRNRQVKPCALPAGAGEICEVDMAKAGGESAYLLFVEFDREQRPVEMSLRAAWSWERLRVRVSSSPLAQLFRKELPRATLDPHTLYQFQVFVPTIAPLSAAQKDRVQQQFVILLERLLAQWRFENPGEASD